MTDKSACRRAVKVVGPILYVSVKVKHVKYFLGINKNMIVTFYFNPYT